MLHNSSFPNSLQGKYQRSGVCWNNEGLNKQVMRYVRENAVSQI